MAPALGSLSPNFDARTNINECWDTMTASTAYVWRKQTPNTQLKGKGRVGPRQRHWAPSWPHNGVIVGCCSYHPARSIVTHDFIAIGQQRKESAD